jgi:plasmid stabilization system protein ParE
MRRFKIRITSPAQRDALEAYSWMYSEAPEAASTFYLGIFEAISTLGQNPARCARAAESITLDREIRHLLYERYRILFTISKDTVVVLRIRHSSRQTLKRIDG